MKHNRGTFEEQLPHFKDFLENQGYGTNLLWITKEQVSNYRNRYWIYRATENHRRLSQQFFDERRKSETSLRLDAVTEIKEGTICWVEDYGGPSGCMNYGIMGNPKKNYTLVESPIIWRLIRALNLFRDRLKRFDHMNITRQERTSRL